MVIVGPALATVLLLQGVQAPRRAPVRGGPSAALEATASVDRTRLRVGEELVLTIRARTRSAATLAILPPPLNAFSIIGSRDFTEVSLGETPQRSTSRELHLRAARPGTVVIGAVRVTQGRDTVRTDPMTITVDSATAGAETGLSLLAHGLLEAAPPPRRTDQVSVAVVVPAETVLVGQQVDVLVAAWFPRAVRDRLRRVPIVTLQTPERVWTYPQVAPEGVAATRKVRGSWMDLFVLHQVLFPLEPGRIVIPAPEVEYSLPVTFSFFSREERYSLSGDSAVLSVLPLPAAGRPSDDAGVVAKGLTIDLGFTPPTTRVGEPLEVAVTLHGTGNVELWPEPAVRWPASGGTGAGTGGRGGSDAFRTYPAQTAVQFDNTDGLIAGAKSFRYLVVPDSAGSFLLPEIRYPYYDLDSGGYRVARIAPRSVAVGAGAEPRAARALPPLLDHGDARQTAADAVGAAMPGWTWYLIGFVPPLLVGLVRRRGHPSHANAVDALPATAAATRLGRLERQFHTVLTSHLPDADLRDGDALARALRAAGLDRAVADHVVRLRERLRAARYGPRGVGDSAELAGELEQVLQVLGADVPGARRRAVTVGVLLLMALAASSVARGQTPSAEALYRAGALRAAADSFTARAMREPLTAAHWYNLGATLYRAGADGKAMAAWTVAARLAPRDPVIRRARALLPAPDAASEVLLTVGPVTPLEAWLLCAALWVLAWTMLLFRRRRWFVLLIVLTVGVATLGGLESIRRARNVAVVASPATPIRVAPFGAASAAATVDAGAAVMVEETYGRWLEVRRADGIHGWIETTEVVKL